MLSLKPILKNELLLMSQIKYCCEKKKKLSSVLLFIILYGYILSPRLDFGVVVHLGLISVIFMVIIVGIKQQRFVLPGMLFYVAIFFFSLAAYHLGVALFFNNIPIYFVSICISVVVSVAFGCIIASFLSMRIMRAVAIIDKLIVLSVLVVFVNSSIIIGEYLLPDMRDLIESILLNVKSQSIYGSYATHPFYFRGLSSAGGAGLSVLNALAVLFLIYLVRHKKLSNISALFASSVIVFSNIFIGRTGLIFGLVFLLFLIMVILIQFIRTGRLSPKRTLAFIVTAMVILIFIVNFNLNQEAAAWAFEWVDGFQTGNFSTASTNDLKSMFFLPDDPIHLLFGIGFFEGDGNIYPRTDSGYLKTILSIGLPLAVLLYSVIIYLFSRLKLVSSRYYWLVVSVVIFMLIVEIKEPFLYQNFAARVMLMLSGSAMYVLARHRTC